MNHGFYYFYASKDNGEGGNQPLMTGPGGAYYVKGAANCSNCGPPYFASYYNYPFELLGDLTGGLRFDAMNHFVIPDADTQGLVLFLSPDGYSMTGGETHDILEQVKRHALARFSSNYTVGFVPAPSGAPRAQAGSEARTEIQRQDHRGQAQRNVLRYRPASASGYAGSEPGEDPQARRESDAARTH